ncbi:MAG: DUF4118 domain-containing protein [Christensenellales bacterium]|jgi:hypothetical protein
MKAINEKQINLKTVLRDTAIAVYAFAVCTGTCFLLDTFNVGDLNFIIIYVLGVLITAVFTKGYVYSSLFSLLSVFAYNFFFTVPRYTLHFSDKMYLVTFILMFAVSVIVSVITVRLKNKMRQINALNMEKAALQSDAEKEKLKATLLRSISHDLRTPLTTMKNGAEIIKDNPALEEEDKNEILDDIILKADWLVRLVENLLSLSRIDSEKLTVKKTPEALEEVIPQAVRNIRGIIGNRTIHYDMPKELTLLSMDATLTIQVIENILNNAVKHTADDGNIWIRVWNTGKNMIFRISNDGSPIRDEDLPHIFEMYYTAADGNRGKDIGLGLAICKLIVTAHGGQICARNTEDGRVMFEFNYPTEAENG